MLYYFFNLFTFQYQKIDYSITSFIFPYFLSANMAKESSKTTPTSESGECRSPNQIDCITVYPGAVLLFQIFMFAIKKNSFFHTFLHFSHFFQPKWQKKVPILLPHLNLVRIIELKIVGSLK